jgi:hypothetical protein
MIRINKTKAKRLYDSGVTIHILPAKVRLQNPWIKPFDANKQSGEDFDKLMANYSYYNLNDSQTGTYAAYYIDEKDDLPNKKEKNLTITQQIMSDEPLDDILKRKFASYSNQSLVDKINRKFQNGENDDDEVHELFRRRDAQGFKVKVGFDRYDLE